MLIKTDNLGVPRFTNKDLIDMIYQGNADKCHVVLCDPSNEVDKFNAAMEKLQRIVGDLLAGPLGSFLDLLSGALNIINYMATPLKYIGGLFLGIYGTMMAINGIGKAIAENYLNSSDKQKNIMGTYILKDIKDCQVGLRNLQNTKE
mgnify:CR=1 FL=1